METILMAAIKTSDNNIATILKPGRHDDISHHLAQGGFKTPIKGEEGFITSLGRFVDRGEARVIALDSGQIITSEFPNRLYTEDLW
jgi:hypothetical protein